MDKEKLRNEIARLIHNNYGTMPLNRQADVILAAALAALEGMEAGKLVRLAENQKRPDNPYPEDFRNGIAYASARIYEDAQDDMEDAGFRRVEAEKPLSTDANVVWKTEDFVEIGRCVKGKWCPKLDIINDKDILEEQRQAAILDVCRQCEYWQEAEKGEQQ